MLRPRFRGPARQRRAERLMRLTVTDATWAWALKGFGTEKDLRRSADRRSIPKIARRHRMSGASSSSSSQSDRKGRQTLEEIEAESRRVVGKLAAACGGQCGSSRNRNLVIPR